jgi:hypothetical protein
MVGKLIYIFVYLWNLAHVLTGSVIFVEYIGGVGNALGYKYKYKFWFWLMLAGILQNSFFAFI